MTGRSHLIINTSAAVAVVTAATMTAATAVVVVATTAAVSKLPDWDMKIGLRRMGVVRTLCVCIIVALAFAAFVPHGTTQTMIAYAVEAVCFGVLVFGLRHRGVTHTVVALAILTLAVRFGLPLVAVAVATATAIAGGVLIGYGGHLTEDACTDHGIPAFWPFYRERVHLLPESLRIGYDSRAEHMVVLLSVAGAVCLGVNAYG